MRTRRFLRLCSRAPETTMAGLRSLVMRGATSGWSSGCARNRPVIEYGDRVSWAAEREIAQSHVVEKFEPRLELDNDVTRDGRLAAMQIQLREVSPCFADREPRQVGDRLLAKAHRERLRIEPSTVTLRADMLIVS